MEGKPPQEIKGLLLLFLFLYAWITLVPAAVSRALPRGADPAPEASQGPSPSPGASPDAAPEDFLSGHALPQGGGTIKKEAPAETGFTLFDAATGETLTVPEAEFTAAALACEMDLASPEEALKAQAVAAYTYYSRLREQGERIDCDTENWLVYVPESAREARWGEDYPEIKALLDKAYATCEEILKRDRAYLEKVAQYLLEHETMDAGQFQLVYDDPEALKHAAEDTES